MGAQKYFLPQSAGYPSYATVMYWQYTLLTSYKFACITKSQFYTNNYIFGIVLDVDSMS